MKKDPNKYPLTKKGCRDEIDRLRHVVEALKLERDHLEILYKQVRNQVRQSGDSRNT